MARKTDHDARPKLVAAARRVFGEVGVDAARIEDIAREAGISKGSFYSHFPGKDAIFSELVSQFFAVMTDLTLQRHEATQELIQSVGALTAEDWYGATPRRLAFDKLEHAHTVRCLQGMWRHRDILRAILDHGGLRGRIVEQFIALAAESVAAQVEASARAGALRGDLDHELVSELVIGMWLQLGRRMVRTTTRPDFEVWARTVDAITSQGLAVQDKPAPARIGAVDPAVNNSEGR